MDSYLFCGEWGPGTCKFILETFQDMAKELGLPLAEEKMEGPANVLTILRIDLDTQLQACRLSDSKLKDLQKRLRELVKKRKVSLKELQELVGHLNFACRMIAPGRPFL